MRETVGSLRFYLILVGVAGLLINVFNILTGLNLLGYVLVAISAALSLAFLYAGIRLRKLLADSPARIRQIIYVNIAVAVLTAGLDLAYGYTQSLYRVAIVIAISVYLLSSVAKLSAQVSSEGETLPAEAS